ncbi:flavin reductase family protein [Pseudomonas putida]|uniref:flavin reductase family protein n=1 Tax=Pseudomonas putida TaxID=303 RepID=UPI0002DBE5B0|nr:flavin reductase family protein [Pseudomonas putida]
MQNQPALTAVDLPEIDSRAFRNALGNFPTGVAIMTAAQGGRKVGITANSFSSVSLNPALILWSIDKRSSSYEIFSQASHFAVNMLAAEQVGLSKIFAKSGEGKFVSVKHTYGAGGAPVLFGCSSHLECELFDQIDAGDHYVILGKVVAFTDHGLAPLVFHRGGYTSLASG